MLDDTSPTRLAASPPSAAARLRWALGLGPVLIGATVLLGWALGLPALKTVLPGLTTMKANTALGLVAAGAGVLLVPRWAGTGAVRWRPTLASAAGAVSFLLGALTLLEYGLGIRLGLDELLFADLDTTSPPYPGRMSPATAAGLACAGAAVLLLVLAASSSGASNRRRQRGALAAHLLAAVPAGVGYLSLAGYAYQVEGLYSFGAFVVVALHTAGSFALLAPAILLTLSDLGWRRAFVDCPVARSTLMRLLPLSLLLPFLAGLAVAWGARARVYDPLYGPALFALAAAAASVGLAWTAAMAVQQAERALREGEARSRQVIDSATDYAIVATGLDGCVTQWNEGARRVLGWTEAEMLGHPVDRFFTPEDVAEGRVTAEMRGALETGRGNDERWHQRKGGERFWAVGEMTVLRDESKAAVGFVKVLRDRTEQRLAEVAERASTARAAFLLDLEQRLRPLSAVQDILTVAAEALGRQLGANQAAYSDIDAAVEFGVIEHEWNDGAIPSNVGVHRIDDFGPGFAADLRAGRTIVVGDVRADPRTCTPAALATFERVSIAAFLSLPVIKDGKLAALFAVHGRTARCWTEREVMLADEVSERVWATVVRARAEAELRASEARLRALNADLERQVEERLHERGRTWAVSPDLLSILNADGCFERCNPAWQRVLGWSEEELRRMRFHDVLHPDDVSRSDAAFEVAKQGKPVLRFENRYRTKAGDYRWLSWVAVPEDGKVYSSARDVTAEKEQAAKLEERTRERDRAWRLSQDLLVIADTAGTLLAVNDAWPELLGWGRDELVGSSFAAFTHPEDLEATLEAFAGILKAPLTRPYEYRLRHKDGTFRWFAWTGGFEDGKVYASGRHTTPEREQAAALAAAEEALRQSQKMEAVGQLTGGLAHDFNNLLAGISGSLELLQARMAQGRMGELDRYIAAAQGASKRAAALTHRLLAFTRRQTLDPKPTDVNRLITGMEELVRRTVGPEVAVEVAGAGGLWATLVDPNQLENALLNLCINARDAMPEGGRLTIETGNRWLDERGARARDLSPGQYVSLCVSDTGTGMTPEVIARAFDPFFTTKPIGMGTGLGLSMIYGFVRQSGGQARIYSEPGQGAMVCLYLPRHHGPAESADEPAEAGQAPRAEQGQTVLVVDDEPTVRMLVTEVLEDLGYTAIEAADGAAGLRVLQSNARLDLLITDVGLPGGLNGRQVADAGRAVRPGLKVLFITGYAENAVVGNGHLDPGMHVLTKPFAIEALAGRIKELITRP